MDNIDFSSLENLEPIDFSKRYLSKDGFETIEIKRGFTEIKKLFDIVYQTGHSFICGGYVRYMASPKKDPYKAHDIDIYSDDAEETNRLKYIFKEHNLEIKHENEMAITYSRPSEGIFSTCPPIQLIKPIIKGKIVARGSMETILENFDFTVVRCAIKNENEILVDADFLHDEEKGMLRIKNIHCPVSSTIRCVKYGKKGYYLTPVEAMRLFIDWDNRDDEYRSKLYDFIKIMSQNGEMTQQQLDEFEAMLRID